MYNLMYFFFIFLNIFITYIIPYLSLSFVKKYYQILCPILDKILILTFQLNKLSRTYFYVCKT